MSRRRAAEYRTLASASRTRLLGALVDSESLTIDELAATAGLHRNTAREHLRRLIDSGFVSCTPEKADGRGRPQLRYSMASANDDSIHRDKIDAAQHRADTIRAMTRTTVDGPGLEPIDRQVDMLDDHLDRAGFDATIDTRMLLVEMHECPFESVARTHPTVCKVHFRLIDQALHDVDGPLEADRLHRLDPVDGCSVDLRLRVAASAETAGRRTT
jgi:predicted ArsR family transcriptional regulator